MRPILALALLAVLGFAATGCGATKKIVVHVDTNAATNPQMRTITVRGSAATLQRVATGRLVTCHGWPAGEAAQVPGSGSVEVETSQAGTAGSPPSPLRDIVVTRFHDGSVSVTCGQSK